MTDPLLSWDAMRSAIDARRSADDTASALSTRARGADASLDERGLCPEEWAARHAQDPACFSGGDRRYSDPELGAWVRRLATILSMDGAVDASRRHYPTPDEMRAVLEREAVGEAQRRRHNCWTRG